MADRDHARAALAPAVAGAGGAAGHSRAERPAAVPARRAIDGPIAAGDTAGLWPLALLYGGAAVLVFVLQYVQTYFLQQAGQRALADLRTRLLTNILRQDQDFFGRMPIGDLVTRLIGDIDSLNALLSTSVVTDLDRKRHADWRSWA